MIIIILGMHRSGTSTVAGLLHLNKISMGTYSNFWPRPLSQNPKGFYENYDFRKINDQILENVGYNVKSYKTQIPTPMLTDKIQNKMEKVISNCNKDYSAWGWKDPRTSITIKQWVDVITKMDLINSLKIIFVARKASSVARSLNKRNNLSITKGLELWKSYTERAFQFCINSNLPVHYCSFESILSNPITTCDNIFDFVGTSWDTEIVKKFVDQSISTSDKGDTIKYPKNVDQLEKNVYSVIS